MRSRHDSLYADYFVEQARTGGVGNHYKRSRIQKGEGLGSFLSSAFSRIFPLIKSGLKTIGRQFLSSGVDVLKDTISGKDIKSSLKDRLKQAGTNLTDKAVNKIDNMVGSGRYKTRKRKARSQSRRSTKARKVNRRSNVQAKRRTGTVGNRRRKRRNASTRKAYNDIFG